MARTGDGPTSSFADLMLVRSSKWMTCSGFVGFFGLISMIRLSVMDKRRSSGFSCRVRMRQGVACRAESAISPPSNLSQTQAHRPQKMDGKIVSQTEDCTALVDAALPAATALATVCSVWNTGAFLSLAACTTESVTTSMLALLVDFYFLS